MRIRGYVGKLPAPRDYAEGGEILKRLFEAQFPTSDDDDWEALAREHLEGPSTAAWSPITMPPSRKTLEALDFEKPPPPLWFLFAGLKRVPVMVLRGANSDLLSAETLDAMAALHPDLEAVTVPDQGHVPALRGRDMIERFQALRGARRRRAYCSALTASDERSLTSAVPVQPGSATARTARAVCSAVCS